MKVIISENQLKLFKKNLISEQTVDQVKEVQKKLNDCCKSGLDVDGIVGSRTAAAIKSCLGIDIINKTQTNDNTNEDGGTKCLTNEGFKFEKGGFVPFDKEKKYPMDDYYQKSTFKVGGKEYVDARAITSTNKNGYNFRVGLPKIGPGNTDGMNPSWEVIYGNWKCNNGKLEVTLSGKKVMKTPGEYGF